MSDLQPSLNAESNPSNTTKDVVISTDNSTITGHILPDGRVNIHLNQNQKACISTKRLKASKRRDVQLQQGEDLTRNNREYETDSQSVLSKYSGLPRLNIAIHIVGSRGDVQPFISIGQILSKPPYSHRVRICTHPVFKDFVEENDLEFFSIGGDPATLMSYMVKNPGLLPGKESWKAGDVTNRRADIAEILGGCWKSCIEPGNGMGGEREGAEANADDGTEEADRLFIADAIIANPPSYGHIHCAEKLAIPLHIMFTMPWSPTQYFPHPLATMTNNHSDPKISNYISYGVMEMLSWQGLGDVINGFRMKTLNLDAISPLWGHMLLSRMKVPFTYLWSSALIPKPPDWGPHIDIAGFSFLSAPLTYQPPDDLVNFLKAGPPPVYIGFGSIVVDNPDQLTEMIFKAVKRAGVRALVSKGWGGIGGEEPPDDVFLLGNCPHDWLFNFVSCVVHHGGAGTTATGVATGKPTVVIPFFGDQPFWGQMIYNSGAGPPPVPYKQLTEERLAESIIIALGPEVQKAVKILSEKIANENGASTAAVSFQSKLQPVNADSMRCFISPEYLAVWRVKKTNVRLCSLAAATLIENGLLDLDQIKLFRHRDWYTDEGARDPLVGLIASISGIMTDAIVNTRKYSKTIWKMVHQKPEKMNSELPNPGIDSELGLSEEMKDFQSQNPESATVAYPPHHLEMVAHEVAAKTLVDKKERSKHRRVYSWSPNQRATKNTQKSQQQHQQSSRFHDVAVETGHYALSVIRTGCNAPVSFFYNVANGFHNAPSFMLHDDTVRERDSITGFGSGVKVAGKGFIFNIFDGVTGVVTQPYFGARKEGTLGFVKGIGKGLGGLVFKPVAAVIGIPGYTFKGIQKQFEKRRDRALKAKIFEVRIRQGSAAYARATAEERGQILSRWKELGYDNLST